MGSKFGPKVCTHPLNQREAPLDNRDPSIWFHCTACNSHVNERVFPGVPFPDAPPETFELNDSDRLEQWWTLLAQRDAIAAIAKNAEYGSRDLEIMGAAMVGGADKPVGPRGVEYALAFYLLGKVARMFGDRPASDDTLRDICTYAMMLRRVRETGRWP